MHPVLNWLIPALFALSLAFLRVTRERKRLRSAWTLLVLAAIAWLAANYFGALLPGPEFIRHLTRAFVLLAITQLAVIFLVDVLLRNIHVPKLGLETGIVASYIAILVQLLLSLGVNVSGLFATSAVAAAVVGLALQEMLGNFVGGITLELEGSIQKGDFIKSGEHRGWVQHVRLRQTTVTTPEGDTLIIPNSQLTRADLLIRARSHRHYIPFVMTYGHNPQEVIDTVEFALRASPMPGIAQHPAPECLIQDLGPSHITYKAKVWLNRPGYSSHETSAVLKRIYFALQRAGIPAESMSQTIEIKSRKATQSRIPTPVEVLRRTPLLRLLSEPDLFNVGSHLRHVSFAPGEHIVTQGAAGDSMFFVISGSVAISYRAPDGAENQIALMQSGDFFGEASLLTGERRSATATAVTGVDCYCLEKASLEHIVQTVPELPEDMSVVMAHRQMQLDLMREKMDQETARKRADENQAQLLARIKRFFSVAK